MCSMGIKVDHSYAFPTQNHGIKVVVLFIHTNADTKIEDTNLVFSYYSSTRPIHKHDLDA